LLHRFVRGVELMIARHLLDDARAVDFKHNEVTN
jgi:hypothetical protein